MRSKLATDIIIVCLVFSILASLAFCLRVYARRLKGNGYHADESIIFSGLVVALGHGGMIIYAAVHAGVGWPVQDLSGPAGRTFEKILIASQVLWAASIALIRIGLLVFYRRIFVIRSFRVADNAMIVVNIAWFTVLFFGTTFSFSWKVKPKINYSVWLIAHAAVDMALDIATLCMPLFVIRTLQISTKKKIMVGAIFWLGFFCIIASTVRLVYFVQLDGIRKVNPKFATLTSLCALWSVVEPCTSIIAACLPTYGPLLMEGRGLKTIIREFASKFSLTSKSFPTPPSSTSGAELPKHRIAFQNDLCSISTEMVSEVPGGKEYKVEVWASA